MASTDAEGVLPCRPDINTVPDEILMKILTFVPYPGPVLNLEFVPYPDPFSWDRGISIQQHDSLKLVSSRFNSIMTTNAFRIELLRRQCNDILELYDITSITTSTEFRTVAVRSGRLDDIVREIMFQDEDDKLRFTLRVGVLVLAYLKCVNTYSTNRSWMVLVEWANKTIFSSQFQEILRFTLARLQTALIPRSSNPINVRWDAEFSNLTNIFLERTHYTALRGIHQMLRYRAFETAFLLSTRPMSLLEARWPKVRNITWEAQMKHYYLGYLFSPEEFIEGVPEEGSMSDGELRAENAKYVQGYHWRLLSPRIAKLPLDLKLPEKSALNIIIDTVMHEVTQNSFTRVRERARSSCTTADFLDVDLKAVGKFLRDAGPKIANEDEDIPEEVWKQSRDVYLLKHITSGVEHVDESTEDEGSEDDDDDGHDEVTTN